MEGNFNVSKTNQVSFQDVQTIPDPQFRAWAQFLNEHSLVAHAFNAQTPLIIDQLIELYCSATDTSDANGYAFSFDLQGGRSIRVTEQDVNRILNFPVVNFVPDPTNGEIHAFFTLIRSQQPDFFVGEFLKNFLPKHWNFFFHTLIHVFTAKTTNFHGIPKFLQKIGYAIAHNMRINFGRLVLGQIIICMGPLENRTLPQNDVICLYPRFLQLILNDLLTDEEKVLYEKSEVVACMKMKRNAITNLINRGSFPEVPTVLTPYLSTVPLPLLPPGQHATGEQEGIIPELNAPDENVPMDIDTVIEPPVVIADQEVEHQQPLSPVIKPLNEPNQPNQTTPNPTTPLKEPTLCVEGDSVIAAPYKELPSTSTAPPPAKRRRTETEASVKNLLIISLTDNTYLSQVDWASLTHTISQPINTRNEEVLTEQTGFPTILRSGSPVKDPTEDQVPSQALGGNSDPSAKLGSLSTSPERTALEPPLRKGFVSETDRKLIDNDSGLSEESKGEKPSQASEGNLGSSLINRPLSTLPEGTSLDPVRDGSTHVLDRQLMLNEEGDLRNPIAPPVTSLRMDKVISIAGTSTALSDTPLSETPTELVSVREINVNATLEEMRVRDKEGNILHTVPLRPSYAKRTPVEAASSNFEDKLKAIEKSIQQAAGDSRRTYNVLGSASGTITGTKASVEALRKEAMEELNEARSDVREVRDTFINVVHTMEHCQQSLAKDVLVIRDSQAMVKDSMKVLARVESRLNQRLDRIEKSTKVRLDNIDGKFEDLFINLKNQNDGIHAIFTMLKAQEEARKQQFHPGTSSQPQQPQTSQGPPPLEDSLTKGEKAKETQDTEPELLVHQCFEIPESSHLQGEEQEHEPYIPEPVNSTS